MISEHASPLATLGGQDAGGQNRHVADLSAALVAAGHEVRVYTRRDANDLPELVRMRNGVGVVHVPAGPSRSIPKDELLPYMREFGQWLARRWRGTAWQPAVVHAHFWMSGVAAMSARRRGDLPVVQTYHALGTVKRRHLGARDTSPRRRVSYERALGQAVDRVIAQCQDEVQELIRMGVPRAQVAVIPSGVDGRLFTARGPAVARDDDRPRILTVSRLVERKGLQDIIAAMRFVPDAECVVIGGPPADQLADDPYARHLLQLADSAGLADRVRLVGAVPHEQIASWYRSADAVVAAPWYEPFGLTPLEAMACGVPVVGTAVGGLIDTIVDEVTGDLVPPRDPRALGTAVSRLLNDPMRRMAYGAAAIDRVHRCYSWHRVAAQLGALYTAVSEPRRPVEAVA